LRLSLLWIAFVVKHCYPSTITKHVNLYLRVEIKYEYETTSQRREVCASQ
jgi:hypothetical protein